MSEKEISMTQQSSDMAERVATELETVWLYGQRDGVDLWRALAVKSLEASHHAELVEALTPSAETKYAYLGEFKMPLTRVDECGDEYTEHVTVSWDVIKEIMAAIRERAKIGCDS